MAVRRTRRRTSWDSINFRPYEMRVWDETIDEKRNCLACTNLGRENGTFSCLKGRLPRNYNNSSSLTNPRQLDIASSCLDFTKR